jgi:hypothetical protein
VTIQTASRIFALAVLAYLAVIAWFSPLPLQDFPNHLARALVLADLLFRHGAQFGDNFSFEFLLTSYLGGDLPLACLVQLLGVRGAALLWSVLTFLSLPAAVYLYLRVTKASSEVLVLMLFVSLYLSTDAFFLMGFMEFKLSIALVLVAFSLIESLRERWSVTYFALYAVLIAVAYFVHLAAVVFIGALWGVSGLWRLSQGRSRVANEAILVAPIVCVLLWHFIGAATYRHSDDLLVAPSRWGTAATKWARFAWDFRRYAHLQDDVVTGAVIVFMAFCMLNRRVGQPQEWLKGRVLEPLSYGLAFLVLYVVLPFSQLEATYIDARALALLPLFLFQGLLSLPTNRESSESESAARPEILTVALAAILVGVNLAALSLHFWKDSNWLASYRATVAKIPVHATVLPIYTDERTGIPLERLHFASYAVIDRQALIPYLFAGDRGNPMKYFRYLHRPYTPDELWYRDRMDGTIDWTKVREQYAYLLVMKPFTAARIRLKTHVVAESDSVALLAVE